MYLTRLDVQIAYLMFLDWLKELREAYEKMFTLTEEQLLAPGYVPGFVK